MSGPVVADSVLTPGAAVRVDLAGGDQAIGVGPRRGVIVGMKTSSGSGVANTLYPSMAGPDAVAALAGPGTQAHLAAKAAFKEHNLALIDLVVVAEPGGGTAATGTVTFDDTTPVTVKQLLTLWIAGREIRHEWLAGETDTDSATRLVTTITALGNELPVTAANGGGTLTAVTLTAKNKGPYGNDIKIRKDLSGGTGGAVTLSGAALTSGATEPTWTSALAAIAGTRYKYVHFCTSNADVATASSSSTPSLVNAQIAANNSGFNAKLQQSIFSHTGAISAVKAGVAQQNVGYCEISYWRNAESLPCEWAGAEMGARMREEAIDPDVNRTNRQDMPYRATLFGSSAQTADAFTAAEKEDLLQSGVAAGEYNSAGVPMIIIPRTTYFKDAFGNTDHRVVYVSQTTTYYDSTEDIVQFILNSFPGAKVIPDRANTQDELPPKVVEESTVRAAVIGRLADQVALGWLREDWLIAAVADGSLRVKVASGNSSKLNIQIPESAVPPLTILDINVIGMTGSPAAA